MTISVQVLMPVSSFTLDPKKSTLVSDYRIADPVYEKYVIVAKEIFLPILRATKSRIRPHFEGLLPLFITYVSEITSILHNQESAIQYWAKKDLEILEESKKRINKIRWIDNQSRQNAIELISILTDYYQNMSIIIKNRRNALQEALERVDSEDLKTSLYGTILAYACLMIMTDPKGKKFVPHKKFQPIIRLGLNMARNLDSYTDTLDILTNPDELELLRKAESESK